MKVYALSPRAAVIDAALGAGVGIVPIGPASLLETLPGPHSGLTVSDPVDAVAVTRSLVADGVGQGDLNCVCLGLGDDSSQTAALVNSALQLANGRCASFISLEQMRDKFRLRKCLGENSPYSGRFWLVEDRAGIADILPSCPHGVVLKPLTGSGSLGVKKIRNDADLDAVQLDGSMLLEECFCGAEYSVESISWDGKHHPLVVTQKSTGEQGGLVETGQLQPARISGEESERLFQAAGEILSTVGYTYGFSHIEFILQDGIPKVVEAHGRVGGDRIADLMQWSIGTHGFELLFKAYRDDVVLPVGPTGTDAEIVFPNLQKWMHGDQKWLETVRDLDGVVEASILREQSARGVISASSHRHAQVIITGKTTSDIAAKIRRLGE